MLHSLPHSSARLVCLLPVYLLFVCLPFTLPAVLAANTAANTLELSDCRISAGPGYPGIKARCGTLARPENPDNTDANTDSATIDLAVAVVPALNLQPEPDPVVAIAGGPGQGSIQFYSSYAGAFEPLRRDRDILLVDQRGTGGSARMDCNTDDDLIMGQYSEEDTIAFTEDCLAALPHDPRFFTTSVAVTDLEAVRLALGYPQLNLYGVSYGTRVAQQFARRYPKSTRTIVLDGVVPPQISLGPEIATEAQNAVDNMIDRCERDKGCGERFPRLRDEFAELTLRLTGTPLEVDLSNPVSGRRETLSFGRMEFSAAIRLLAYHPNTIALMPLLIHEAANGNPQPLAAQFQMTVSALSEALSLGMHNAVMCTEDVPFYDAGSIDYGAIEASYIGLLQLDALEAICSIWPAGPIDEGFKEPLATDIPALLLSGSADPITPPRYAQMAAVDLSNARLLTGRNQGHGQLAVGCMPRLIRSFVNKLALDETEDDCFDEPFAMPFFLDFAGPEP